MDLFRKKFMKTLAFKPKVKEVTQLHFLKRLHRLLSSGYSLLSALEVMKWDKEIKQSATIMIESLKKGHPIDEAFEKAHFHKLIVTYLYFVRLNGNLLSSLEKSYNMFEHRITYMNKFVQVLRYPLILFFTFIILLVFLKQSVLPSFLELFESSFETSSRSVVFSIMIIDIASTLFFITLAFILIGTIFWYAYKRNISIAKQLVFYERIPVLRTFLKLQTSFYFSTHLSMFLKAGLSIKDTLAQMSEQKKLPIIAHYTTLMTEKLTSGSHIDHLLLVLPFIDKQLANIFQKNHNMTILAKDLTAYSDFLAEYIERKVMRIITLIQPIFFIILAGFIVLVYLSLMWPMFQLIQTV